jgi:hypothetical protein
MGRQEEKEKEREREDLLWELAYVIMATENSRNMLSANHAPGKPVM